MVTKIWVNIGSGKSLLPDTTKPLPEPMLTYHQWYSSEDNFTSNISAINHWNKFENDLYKIPFKSPRGQWAKCFVMEEKACQQFIVVNIIAAAVLTVQGAQAQHTWWCGRALGGPEVRAPENPMGPLWNFAWGPNGPPKIGELVMYFNGGTLQILLGALGNSNGGDPGPSTKNVYREPCVEPSSPAIYSGPSTEG